MIGQFLWYYDIDRRNEDKAKNWQEYKVVGETRKFWLIRPVKMLDSKYSEQKVVKETMTCPMRGKNYGDHKLHTRLEMEEEIWISKYRHKLVTITERLEDVNKLKQIAAILGVS